MEGTSLFKDHLVAFDEFPTGHDTPLKTSDDTAGDSSDDDPNSQDDEPIEGPDDTDDDNSDSGDDSAGDDQGSDEGDADDELVDEKAKGFYEYLTGKGLIQAQGEDFKPTVENVQQLLDSLPEQFFIEAVTGVHSDAQQLLQYAFHLGENATVQELSKFFDQYLKGDTVNLEDEQSAYDYLKDQLKGNKAFPTEAKLTAYLDSLLDDGALQDTAKQLEEERKAVRQTQMQAQIEQAKADKIKNEEEIRQYYTTLYEEVSKQGWDKERKQQVLKNLEPSEATRKNQLITQSPKAMIQLADFFSRFDEKTGTFDMSDYGLKGESKKAKANKAALEKDGLRSILDRVTSGQKDSKQGKSGSFWADIHAIND